VSRAAPTPRGTTFAALLRGVNVGGKNKLPMRDLCALFARLGHEDVASYIQSGNVVFSSFETDPALVSNALEKAIAERFDANVSVLLREHSELADAAAANPFLKRGPSGSKLHVLFLSAPPAPAAIETLDPHRSPGDEFGLSGKTIYLSYPNGSGRTKLTLDYFERRLGLIGTVRNWNTLLKLVELTTG
jgi:uncharacterized protein (DUF1697 family)